jgi:hypothetical protein
MDVSDDTAKLAEVLKMNVRPDLSMRSNNIPRGHPKLPQSISGAENTASGLSDLPVTFANEPFRQP